MTYKECYMMFDTVEELLKEVQKDIETAMFLGNNPDRLKKIKDTAEEVLNDKFSNYELNV